MKELTAIAAVMAALAVPVSAGTIGDLNESLGFGGGSPATEAGPTTRERNAALAKEAFGSLITVGTNEPEPASHGYDQDRIDAIRALFQNAEG